MNIFSKLFKKADTSGEPNIQFGRYSDTYKSEDKYKNWDKALEFFNAEKYLQSYTSFLNFLADDSVSNLKHENANGKITFEFLQGSKVIQGEADVHHFKAESKIAKMAVPHIGMMRKLLEENFELKYSRYAIDDDNCLCLAFDTYVEDGAPHKIYQALREVATISDKKDDILIDEFPDLKTINDEHTKAAPDNEIALKYAYFKSECSHLIHALDNIKLNTFLYPGSVSFLLLDFFYKIDYLVKPEGPLMTYIQEMHAMYFENNIMTVHEKNKKMISMLRDFDQYTLTKFAKEIYNVNATFGNSIPGEPQRFAEIVDAQMSDFDWYFDNGHHVVCDAICGYIVGFTLYSYAMPEPIKELLTLFYKITERKYFNDLGFKDIFYKSNGQLNKTEILKAFKNICQFHELKYGKIILETKYLDTSNLLAFKRTYIHMIKNMTFRDL